MSGKPALNGRALCSVQAAYTLPTPRNPSVSGFRRSKVLDNCLKPYSYSIKEYDVKYVPTIL